MPVSSGILAGAAALPGIFGVVKDIFGGGGDDSGGNTGYASVDPAGQEFNKYMMDFMKQKMQQPHNFRPVPQMPYNIMNMASQAYGMGPYQDPGWMKSNAMPGGGGMPGGGMPGMPSINKSQLRAPQGGGMPGGRTRVMQ